MFPQFLKKICNKKVFLFKNIANIPHSFYSNNIILEEDFLIQEILEGNIGLHQLESLLKDEEDGYFKSVQIRRKVIAEMNSNFNQNYYCEERSECEKDNSCFKDFNYESIFHRNCENVIGYVKIPVGMVGPLHMNGKDYFSPIGTTEGCLVASIQRGCKAVNLSGGIHAFVMEDAMSRGPIIEMNSLNDTYALEQWIQKDEHFQEIKEIFESSSNYAELKELQTKIIGRKLLLRFVCSTGEAMGMNMVSKGVEKSLLFLAEHEQFKGNLKILSVSGNYCVDKKSSALNWILGRGKRVSCDVTIPKDIIESIFRLSVSELVQLNIDKNLVGSAVSGSIGGFNAHASNMVTGMYIALGQDVAQVVESSTCLTYMEEVNEEGDLYMSCTMPSIEVGTIGGGTELPNQRSFLELSGIMNEEEPSKTLAMLVCSTVLCGELSILAALRSGELVQSHMKMNRKK